MRERERARGAAVWAVWLVMGQLGDSQSERLEAVAVELEAVEQRRRELLADRKRLALELIDAGWSEREVAGCAHVTGVAVHHWKREWETRDTHPDEDYGLWPWES